MSNITYNETAVTVAAKAASPTSAPAGTETLWINYSNNKSAPIANVKSYSIDPPVFSDWNTNVTYAATNVVRATDNNLYVSLVNSNQGNSPLTSPTDWSPLPMQRYFDGDIFRNENVAPAGQSFGITPINTAVILNPGVSDVPTTLTTPGLIILNDEQTGTPPHPTAKIRSRYVFLRQSSDASPVAMVTREVWCDQVLGITDGPMQ